MSAEAEDKKFVVSISSTYYSNPYVLLGIVRYVKERDVEPKPRVQEDCAKVEVQI